MTAERWFRTHNLWVATVFGLIALACFFGPDQWFSAHSLRVFRDLTHIPWAVTGIAFAAVPALLTSRRCRVIGYGIGFVLACMAEFTLVLFTLQDHQVINAVISLLALLPPLTMLTGIRYCIVGRIPRGSER